MNEQRHDHGNPPLRLLVDALQDVSSLRTAHERHLVLELLRHKLGNGFHVRGHRRHVIRIGRQMPQPPGRAVIQHHLLGRAAMPLRNQVVLPGQHVLPHRGDKTFADIGEQTTALDGVGGVRGLEPVQLEAEVRMSSTPSARQKSVTARKL